VRFFKVPGGKREKHSFYRGILRYFDRRHPGYVRNKYYNTLVKKKSGSTIIVADQEGEKAGRKLSRK
jgi:hypothetical protein